jgi:hypothetical protein
MPRCPNGTRRNKRTGECERYTRKSKTRKSPAQRSTLTDAELDEIISQFNFSADKMAELAKLRPRMKRMRYSKKYVSCFGEKPKNLHAMMFNKIACWGKYGEDI